MEAYLHNKSKYPRIQSISKKWNRHGITYIVQDVRPLDSLGGEGLKTWVEAMAPRYSLPTHNYVLYNVSFVDFES